MKLIVGLGNPGAPYKQTRHNIGFEVIDELADRFQSNLNQSKFKGVYTIIHTNGEKLILLKPLTYMNLSGESVKPIMDYYNLSVKDLLVIYDDMDIPVGKIRLRQKGSAGGHNGIKSIIAHTGTQEFNRIRIGVGRPPEGMGVADYVLSKFQKEEWAVLQDVIKDSADACEEWIDKPFLEVMNHYN